MKDNATYEKKGQLAGSAVGNIITLIVGVGVSVLVLIFVGSLGGQTYELVESDIDAIGYTAFAENFTASNSTAQTLARQLETSYTSVVKNFTGGTAYNTIDASNYTLNATNFILDANTLFNGVQVQVNYTYHNTTIVGSIKSGILSSFEALEQTGDYLPIIVLAVVISLVLMLVLGFTMFGANRGGGGSAL